MCIYSEREKKKTEGRQRAGLIAREELGSRMRERPASVCDEVGAVFISRGRKWTRV